MAMKKERSMLQQLDEAYRNSRVVVVCLWPESKAIGPIYGYDEPQPYDKLMKMMHKIMDAIDPKDLHEYPSPHVFDWPLSEKAMTFLYCLENATAGTECEMILKQLGWEKKR